VCAVLPGIVGVRRLHVGALMMFILWSEPVVLFQLVRMIGKYPNELLPGWIGRTSLWKTPVTGLFFLFLSTCLSRFGLDLWSDSHREVTADKRRVTLSNP
jgi:hypothetical protein